MKPIFRLPSLILMIISGIISVPLGVAIMLLFKTPIQTLKYNHYLYMHRYINETFGIGFFYFLFLAILYFTVWRCNKHK